MPRIIEQEATTFKDYVIVPGTAPQENRPNSRDPIYYDFSTTLGELKLTTPMLTANMTTVTGTLEAVEAFSKAGAVPVLHQFAPIRERVEIIQKARDQQIDRKKHPYASVDYEGRPIIAAAIGFEEALNQASQLIDAGVNMIVFDSQNGYTPAFQDIAGTIASLRDKKDTKVVIVSGNIATANGVEELAKAGSDVVKVGIGPGTGCGTGPEIGTHVPQMTALSETYEAAVENSVEIIGDGGIKKSLDMNKALIFCHAIMGGKIFAATLESSAEKRTELDGRVRANYKGSGSNEARRERNEKYPGLYKPKAYETVAPEGYDGWLEVTGSADALVQQYLATLARAMHYVGVRSLYEYREHGVLQRLSLASREELIDKVNNSPLINVEKRS